MSQNMNNSYQMSEAQKIFILVFAYALFFLIFWGDFITGIELDFSLFYFAPIALVAWYCGFWSGLFMALFCTIASVSANSTVIYSKQIIYAWEFGINLGIFVIVFLFTHVLRTKLTLLEKNAIELKALNHELYELSMVDSLTRLHNRRFLDEHLPKQLSLAHRHNTSIALILFDFDDFKMINDK